MSPGTSASLLRVGDALVDSGMLQPGQLAQALSEQLTTGERLDWILVRLGFVRPEVVSQCLIKHVVAPPLERALNIVTDGGYDQLHHPTIGCQLLSQTVTITDDLLDAAHRRDKSIVIYGVASIRCGEQHSLPFSFSTDVASGIATIERLDAGGLRVWIERQNGQRQCS